MSRGFSMVLVWLCEVVGACPKIEGCFLMFCLSKTNRQRLYRGWGLTLFQIFEGYGRRWFSFPLYLDTKEMFFWFSFVYLEKPLWISKDPAAKRAAFWRFINQEDLHQSYRSLMVCAEIRTSLCSEGFAAWLKAEEPVAMGRRSRKGSKVTATGRSGDKLRLQVVLPSRWDELAKRNPHVLFTLFNLQSSRNKVLLQSFDP